MLFLTNRYPIEDFKNPKLKNFTFNLDDVDPSQIIFFCKKNSAMKYSLLEWSDFFRELKNSSYKSLLFFIHGYSNTPEEIFEQTIKLQKLCDLKKDKEVLVVPFIWPCDNDPGKIKDYYDDQVAADRSATSLVNALNDFLKWGKTDENQDIPCLKRINILAHSMGNRVLRQALFEWQKYYQRQGVPLVSRNTFLVAADIENESLEIGKQGQHISDFSRNVVVYFSADDLALRGSKVANLANGLASRRLGHTGPENIEKCKKNVFSIDCDNINNYDYDTTKKINKKDLMGHNYLVEEAFFNHMFSCIITGRVEVDNLVDRTFILK